MSNVSQFAESLAETAAQTSVGDISSMAELLERLEAYSAALKDAQLPNLHTAAEAVGEIVKKVIMDAVPDSQAAFEVAARSIGLLRASTSNGDIGSFAQFPTELNLGDAAAAAAPPTPQDKSRELVDEEILAEFFDQNFSALEEVESLVLQLEKTQHPDALGAIRRYIHTIKGESGFIGFNEIEAVCHATENFLEESEAPYDVEHILTVIDWLRSALTDLSAGNPLSRGSREILSRLEHAPVTVSETPATSAQAASVQPESAGEPSGEDEPLRGAQPGDGTGPGTDAGDHSDLLPEAGFWELSGDTSLLSDFVSESKEHLEVASKELLNLESDPGNQEALNSVFRAFHTIKGIASFLELQEILRLAHDAENLLDMTRKGTLELTPGLVDLAFESLDLMGELIGKVKSALEGDGRLAPEPALPGLLEKIRLAASGMVAESAPVEPTDQMLGSVLVESGAVSESDVTDVLAQERAVPTGKKIGELLVETKKAQAKDVAEAIRRQKADKGSPVQQASVDLKETIRVDYDRLENMVDTIGELVVAEAMITQDDHILDIKSETLGKKLHNFRMISRKLQELGTTIRMVPIAGTFQKMARLVRDLSKKSGKSINFRTVGEETELDRAYVDKIGDPLVHMIRNSVDHGIEMPADRVKAGKNEQALVELRAYHEGGAIIIEIRDDGRGINKEAVRAKAIERGVIQEEERLSDQEIFHLIFKPGFSTAAQVTEVSGRGVGMDVVRRNIEELRGQIQISSEEGVGTTFRLVLPLTLALIDGMVVRVGGERYIFPVLSVLETLRADAEMLHTLLGKGEMISLRDRQLPFFRLGALFGLPEAKNEVEEALVVVVENEGREIGLLVDDLVGLQQTVIKSLGVEFAKTEGVAGGAIMADGKIGLILDVPGLFRVAASNLSSGLNVSVNVMN
jgi:two-component system chemotaxis sensor kinase CheA